MFGRKSKEIEDLKAKIRSIEMDKEWNIIHYLEETQRLEKALDIACEELEKRTFIVKKNMKKHIASFLIKNGGKNMY